MVHVLWKDTELKKQKQLRMGRCWWPVCPWVQNDILTGAATKGHVWSVDPTAAKASVAINDPWGFVLMCMAPDTIKGHVNARDLGSHLG